MKVTFLGTGTSQGVPFIGCTCEVCTSCDPKDKRLRTSIHLEIDNLSIVIDTGPDFRQQMLRAGIVRLDHILYTHSHKDHVAGMDDIRAYNYLQQKAIDIHCTEATLKQLKAEFAYVFAEEKYPGIPEIDVHLFHNHPFQIDQLNIIPIRTLHYKMEVFGFRIKDFVYITDANQIAPEELEKTKGCQVLVLNALRHEKHISHFSLPEALDIVRQVQPQTAYFTHISHQLGKHQDVEQSLPDSVYLAYDGLSLNL